MCRQYAPEPEPLEPNEHRVSLSLVAGTTRPCKWPGMLTFARTHKRNTYPVLGGPGNDMYIYGNYCACILCPKPAS